jgi:hypothetical protein
MPVRFVFEDYGEFNSAPGRLSFYCLHKKSDVALNGIIRRRRSATNHRDRANDCDRVDN